MAKANKRFSSNAEMAQHYTLKLLSDGKAHNKAEILNYVQEKTGGIGVGGERLTDETIASAIWYGIRHGTADYKQTVKGWFQKNTPLQNPLATSHAYKETIYFLAEQARCLKRIGNAAAEICKDAAAFLIGGDENLQAWLAERTGVKRFRKRLEDYELEDFIGKGKMLNKALEDLHRLSTGEEIPSAMCEKFMESADIIAGFYGKDLEQDQTSDPSMRMGM